MLDPTFNMDKKRTKEMLSLLVEKAPDIHFTFENRAELLDEEMVRLYGQLDCSLQLGMQSSDPVVLKAIDRAANMTAFENGVRMLVKEGVSFGLDVIIGLPGDTLEGFFHSLDYAISLKPNNIDLFLLSLLPGTTLADRADRLGLRHQEQNPYLLIESPTFPKEDIATALSVKTAVDLFYTKGQAYQWFPLLEEAGGMKAHQLMLDFATFLTTQHPEETDVYELQDRFVKKVLKRQGKTSLPSRPDLLHGTVPGHRVPAGNRRVPHCTVAVRPQRPDKAGTDAVVPVHQGSETTSVHAVHHQGAGRIGRIPGSLRLPLRSNWRTVTSV
ncbi:MAG: radical SAM protein [Sphaerochaeta sp.]|nr:radical SAM protein [Sphaerochaeta sp.]